MRPSRDYIKATSFYDSEYATHPGSLSATRFCRSMGEGPRSHTRSGGCAKRSHAPKKATPQRFCWSSLLMRGTAGSHGGGGDGGAGGRRAEHRERGDARVRWERVGARVRRVERRLQAPLEGLGVPEQPLALLLGEATDPLGVLAGQVLAPRCQRGGAPTRGNRRRLDVAKPKPRHDRPQHLGRVQRTRHGANAGARGPRHREQLNRLAVLGRVLVHPPRLGDPLDVCAVHEQEQAQVGAVLVLEKLHLDRLAPDRELAHALVERQQRGRRPGHVATRLQVHEAMGHARGTQMPL